MAADADGVAGYCLVARDTRAFEGWAEASWWPALRAQYPRGTTARRCGLIALLHEPAVAHPTWSRPTRRTSTSTCSSGCAGRASVERLVERQLLADLAAAGAPACHLGAASSNANAIAFYEHLGWRVLDRGAEDCVMGIELR